MRPDAIITNGTGTSTHSRGAAGSSRTRFQASPRPRDPRRGFSAHRRAADRAPAASVCLSVLFVPSSASSGHMAGVKAPKTALRHRQHAMNSARLVRARGGSDRPPDQILRLLPVFPSWNCYRCTCLAPLFCHFCFSRGDTCCAVIRNRSSTNPASRTHKNDGIYVIHDQC